MADVVPLDKYGRIKYNWDPDEEVFKVALQVYNPLTLGWERMVQPKIELSAGDLTVTLGDVERLLSNQYYKRTRIYAHSSGRIKYLCKNTDVDAETTDTDWLCWKFTDAALPNSEGPRSGAVNTEGTVDALSWKT